MLAPPPSLHLCQVVGHFSRGEHPELAVLTHHSHLNVVPRQLACGGGWGWGGEGGRGG